MEAPAFRIADVELYERDVSLRMPFRFGVGDAHRVSAGVRARARRARRRPRRARRRCGADGPEVVRQVAAQVERRQYRRPARLRCAAQRRPIPRPATHAHGIRAFRRALPRADRGWRGGGPQCAVANYGPALLDRAVLDALCRLLALPFARSVRANLPGIDATLTPDLAVPASSASSPVCGHRRRIAARHTVGMLDPVTASRPVQAASPTACRETLEEVIARTATAFQAQARRRPRSGHRTGSTHIATALDRLPLYAVTLGRQ